MVFSLSFGGVQVRLSTSNDTDTNYIKGVRHCDNGNIELDASNFTGTIVLSAADAPSTQPSTSSSENEVVSRDMQVVQGVPEELNCSLSSVLQKFSSSSPSNNNNTPTISTEDNNIADGIQRQSSYLTANSHTSQIEPSAFIPQHNNLPELLSQQNSQLTVEIDSEDDDEEKKMQHVQDDELQSSGLVRFSLNKPQVIPDLRPEADLTLHELCASDDVEIDDLRDVLRSKPELASVQDKFGDYAAHIFANNDSFIYTSSDCKFFLCVCIVWDELLSLMYTSLIFKCLYIELTR